MAADVGGCFSAPQRVDNARRITAHDQRSLESKSKRQRGSLADNRYPMQLSIKILNIASIIF
jgi:hypothetical protein